MADGILTINVKPVGNACNIRCAYCDIDHAHSEQKQFDILSYQSELSAINSKINFVHVVFHGGEPLLAPLNLLEKIISCTKSMIPGKCDFQIQTNGVSLSDEIISFIKENECKLSISFDPFEENFRYPRETCIDVKAKIIKAVLSGCNPGILSVAHGRNYTYFDKFMKMISDWGIRYWTLNKIRATPKSNLFLSEDAYLALLLKITKIWIEHGVFQRLTIQPIVDLLSPEENHSCHFSPNIMKCACFAVFSGCRMLPHCEHYQNIAQDSFEKCRSCDFFPSCGGGCITDLRDDDFCLSRRHFFQNLQCLKQQIGVDKI